MFYFVGDIHGYLNKLTRLMSSLESDFIKEEDTLIFLGDYIDRGGHSYEVIEFLIELSKKINTVFLKGNHEEMLFNYLQGSDQNDIYLANGGMATIRSYKRNIELFEIPEPHKKFFNSLRLFYEGEDFIAVHAGLNPEINSMDLQDKRDLLWIREKFFRANKRWDKTVIFGHSPSLTVTSDSVVYFDDKRNIIGIDSGVIFGGPLSCLRWPDKKLFLGI